MVDPGDRVARVDVDELVAEFVDRHDPSVSGMVHVLTEETGEVAEAYMELSGQKLFAGKASKDELATELADVAYTVRVLANIADIDLDSRLRNVAEYNLEREDNS